MDCLFGLSTSYPPSFHRSPVRLFDNKTLSVVHLVCKNAVRLATSRARNYY